MKKLFKTLAITALTGVVALSAVACGGNTNKSDNDLSVLMLTNGSDVSINNKNWVKDYINKESGFNVTFEEVERNYPEVIAAKLTTPKKLPDIILASGLTRTSVLEAAEDGVFVELDKYLKDAPNWNRLNEECVGRKESLVLADGHIYTYGSASAVPHETNPAKMWVSRPAVQEWNASRGKTGAEKDTTPVTVQEFQEYLTWWQTNKAGKNMEGVDGVQYYQYALTGITTATESYGHDFTGFLSNAFGYSNYFLGFSNTFPNMGYYVEDGKVKYTPFEKSFLDYMKYMKGLKDAGVLDPNLSANTKSNLRAPIVRAGEDDKLQQPRVAAFAASGGPDGDMSCNGERRWLPLQPLKNGADGAQYSMQKGVDYFDKGIGIVTSNCKNVKKAIEFLDWTTGVEVAKNISIGPQNVAWGYTDETKTKWELLDTKFDANKKVDYTNVYKTKCTMLDSYFAEGDANEKYNSYYMSGSSLIGTATPLVYKNRVFSAVVNADKGITADMKVKPQDQQLIEYTQVLAAANGTKSYLMPEFSYTNEEAQTMSDAKAAYEKTLPGDILNFILGTLSETEFKAKLNTYKTNLDKVLNIFQAKYDAIKK